jgi:hypothetical protein
MEKPNNEDVRDGRVAESRRYPMKAWINFLAAILIFLCACSICAQTTAFTFQGKLTDLGNPASGSYQMQFKMFDALSGGTQIGGAIPDVGVTVTDGVFTTKLDFGVTAFPGADRFLEIEVRRNSSEAYVTLSPRQQIASSPYSVKALSAVQADTALDSQKLGGVNASEYVTNSSVGSSFIRNGTTLQTGNFNISGNGLIGGSVGIGTVPSAYRLDVAGYIRSVSNASTGVSAETTGGQNSWARFYMRSLNSNGTINQGWLMGTSRDFNANQFYLADETAGNSRMTIQPNGGAISFPLGNIGLGTGNPNTRLTLNGGATWTSNGWTASMNLQNASALGWEANASGQRFGIGQSGGGLYFFRTNSAFGTTGTPANYDMSITDTGNIAQPSARFGLPKAMVYIISGGGISRCYNGVTGSSNGNCGFSVFREGTGAYRIDFGFQISDRFYYATAAEVDRFTNWSNNCPCTANQLRLEIVNNAGASVDSGVMVIVF